MEDMMAAGTKVERSWQLDGATATVRLAFEQPLPFDVAEDWRGVEAALDHLMRVLHARTMSGVGHDE
jgi:hypothetical protein